MATTNTNVTEEQQRALDAARRRVAIQKLWRRLHYAISETKQLYIRFHHSRYAPLIQFVSGVFIAVISRVSVPASHSWWLWQLRLYGTVLGVAWLGIGIYNFLMRTDGEAAKGR